MRVGGVRLAWIAVVMVIAVFSALVLTTRTRVGNAPPSVPNTATMPVLRPTPPIEPSTAAP